MRPSIYDVANYFRVKLSQSEGSSLTHLKLQKLAYYAQAWSLVLLDSPLIEDDFEAWAHGPVNRNLYARYADYKWGNIEPIDEESLSADINAIFSSDQLDVLDQVWEIYGDFDAKYLERLTHQERPWIEARGDLPPGAYCNTVISQSVMKEFYTELMRSVQGQT
ncbi:Panacea domain-containing protein [Alicyclobacillus tolerans]|uniref:Panacea domain-containing protein n=1 Tax=Alicyclobacillus tolerans TaxID=90970 RepID=UPI003B7E3092